MSENTPAEKKPGRPAGRRTITITLPSWSGVGAAFLGGILMAVLILGGMWGYRHLENQQRLEKARNEMALFFKDNQAKASALLQVAERDANQLQLDLTAAQNATKSASISLGELAARQEGLVQDLNSVQAVFSGLAEHEQSVAQRYQLAPNDTLFTAGSQDQFNQLQQQWQDLNGRQAQLVAALQSAGARKDSLVVAEQKALADAAAKKAALARSKARTAQSSQNAPVAVFGAPAYPGYTPVGYYGGPVYGGGYYGGGYYGGGYYRRPYGGGYGYGPGWYGPATSVGFGFSFR